MAYLAAAITALLLAASAVAQAPTGAPSALPQGFGQVEAELRHYVDTSEFLIDFSTISGNAGANQAGQLRYVIGQTNNALFTLPRDGLSQGQIGLDACALWTPHYHPRASEILYVIKGNVSMAFSEENSVNLTDGSTVGGRVLEYVVPEGSSLLVPQGLIHHVYNPSCDTASIITNFDHRDPGVVSIVNQLFKLPGNIISAATGLEDLLVLAVNQTVSHAPIIGLDKACLKKCPAAGGVAPSAGK